MKSPFLSPCKITQKFGERPEYYGKWNLNGHEGIDLVPVGVDWGVHSLVDGSVILDHDLRDTAYGNSVRILDDDGIVTTYCHLSENCVNLGDDVVEGQLIGVMGNTGNSDGAHLHLGTYRINDRQERLNVDNGFKGYVNPEGVHKC